MTEAEYKRRHEENLEMIRNFRLLDDDFLTVCFEGDTACTELVLRIILEKDDLTVTEVHTQVFVANLGNRSVRLDILATDRAGKKYNIEIQRDDQGAGRRRARFYASALDVKQLEKGKEFDELPEVLVIFITENDVMKRGLPVYHIDRIVRETGEVFDDGSHILYVNGAYRSDTPIGKLMHDFSCTDPAEMHYPVLADRTRFFKESKEGVAIMCKAMEERLERTRQEERNNIAKKMLQGGKLPLEAIAEYSGLSFEELKKLQAQSM